MSFSSDNYFSKHKDIMLKPYFSRLAFEGRFILTNSEMLQKRLGIDAIIQIGNDFNEISIDTKHIAGDYNRLFIEEMSCSVEGREKEGWGIRKKGLPDYIMHVLHPACNGCTHRGETCMMCNYSFEKHTAPRAYITSTSKLQQWYLPKMQNGEIERYKLYTSTQINKTTGRNIPIETMLREMGTKKCNLTTSL